MSATKIDNYILSVWSSIAKKHGASVADREISVLSWYIHSGRASIEFLKKLTAAKPFLIARRIHKGGSDLEIIARIKKCIGYEDTL